MQRAVLLFPLCCAFVPAVLLFLLCFCFRPAIVPVLLLFPLCCCSCCVFVLALLLLLLCCYSHSVVVPAMLLFLLCCCSRCAVVVVCCCTLLSSLLWCVCGMMLQFFCVSRCAVFALHNVVSDTNAPLLSGILSLFYLLYSAAELQDQRYTRAIRWIFTSGIALVELQTRNCCSEIMTTDYRPPNSCGGLTYAELLRGVVAAELQRRNNIW